MADVAEMKPQGQTKIDAEAARKAGDVAKGHALAILCVRYATQEAKEEERRGAKRLRFVADIANLTHDGHQEFRKELQIELAALTDVEKVTGQDDSRHGGYAASSFRVMVSNWRTISAACELGYSPFDADGSAKAWETVLSEARGMKKAAVSAGKTVAIEGTRKAGGGRKQLTAYDRALKLAVALDKRDQRRLMESLAAMLGAEITYKSARVKTPNQKAMEAPTIQ